jgi:hypothetical protein
MSTLIFILVWAACAWGGYAIGKGKNRETLGLVLGLLLGIIGIIIIAVMPTKTA